MIPVQLIPFPTSAAKGRGSQQENGGSNSLYRTQCSPTGNNKFATTFKCLLFNVVFVQTSSRGDGNNSDVNSLSSDMLDIILHEDSCSATSGSMGSGSNGCGTSASGTSNSGTSKSRASASRTSGSGTGLFFFFLTPSLVNNVHSRISCPTDFVSLLTYSTELNTYLFVITKQPWHLVQSQLYSWLSPNITDSAESRIQWE